ncbi:hypothetical protein EDD37DRAFT_662320 [Exophiala viscosa]|uniref:uncharacterized protein n=1 Tax=Exophiala viscosa TaxID=2486360 RepID=UPI00219C477E|nr:hypothetical protein EDD37DRAFT_662320 [Exophiala viscosa]
MDTIRAPFQQVDLVTHGAAFKETQTRERHGALSDHKHHPVHIRAEKLHYLKAVGVFNVPDASTTKLLLETYIKNVHPFFPLIDLHDFLVTTLLFDAQDSMPGAHLMLFYSVLAAGLKYVDPSISEEINLALPGDFKESLHNKVKALHQMDYERDRLVLCQSMILMSIVLEDPDDPEECRKWLNLAWHYLESSPLLNNTSRVMCSARTEAMWRRNWWAWYVQDRRLSIAIRRPVLRPLLADIVPQLSLTDFEVRCHSPTVTDVYSSVPMLSSTKLQSEAIEICIANNELYTHFDFLLLCENVDFCQGPWDWGPYQPRHRVWQQQRADHSREQGRRRLLKWVTTYSTYVLGPQSLAKTDDVWGQCCTELQIVSTSALSLLICSDLSKPEGNQSVAHYQKSLVKLMESATDITDCFLRLGNLGLLHCISTSTIQLLMPVAALHLNQCQSQETRCRTPSFRRLRQCAAVLKSLRSRHPSARACSAFLESVIERLTGSAGRYVEQSVESVPRREEMHGLWQILQSANVPMVEAARNRKLLSTEIPACIGDSHIGSNHTTKSLHGNTTKHPVASYDAHDHPPSPQAGTKPDLTTFHSLYDANELGDQPAPDSLDRTSTEYLPLDLWTSVDIPTGPTMMNTAEAFRHLSCIEPHKLTI